MMFATAACGLFVLLLVAWTAVSGAMAIVELRDGVREHSLTGRWSGFQATLVAGLSLFAVGAGLAAVSLVRLLWL